MKKNAHWLDELERKSRDSVEGLRFKTNMDHWGEEFYSPHQFFYELVANADDEGATTAQLIIDNNKVIFQHNGNEFTKEDVEDITSYLKKKKYRKLDKIGNFGAGFKTVLQLCNEPEISSIIDNELICFTIQDKVVPCRKKLSGWVEKKLTKELKKNGKTKFVFPIDKKNHSQQKYLDKESFKNFLKKNNFLLFLPNIGKINFKIGKSTFKFEKKIEKIDNNLFKVFLTNQEKGKKLYYLYSEKFSIDGYEGKATVSVAYQHDLKKNIFIPEYDGKNLYVFFNTQEEFAYKFSINAPFRTIEGRTNLRQDNTENDTLKNYCDQVVYKSVLSLRDNKIINITFFDLMPIESDKIKNFKNIQNNIYSCLQEQSIWPTNNAKSYYNRRNIIYGDIEYRKVFKNEDLKNLSMHRTWLDYSKSKRINSLLVDHQIEKFDTNLLDNPNVRWDLIVKNKDNKKISNLYLFLNSKLYEEILKGIPVIKSASGNFHYGHELRFPAKNKNRHINFIDNGFLSIKQFKKKTKEHKDFFIKCGVRDVSLQDFIKADVSDCNFEFNSEIKIPVEKYEEILNKFLTLFCEDKLILNANQHPYLIDSNRVVRRAQQLYIDNENYSTGLDVIYKDKVLEKYRIFFPKKINLGKYLALLKHLDVQIKLEIKQFDYFINRKIERRFYRQQGRPSGNSKPTKIDYWIENLENITKNMNLEKSFLLRDILNSDDENYCNFIYAQYSVSKRSPPLTNESSLLLHLKNNKWIPDENNKFDKMPSELTEQTINEKFYKNVKGDWLEKIGFGIKNEENVEFKKSLVKRGFDPWMSEHPEEAKDAIARKKSEYYREQDNREKRKKLGPSHGKPQDDNKRMNPYFTGGQKIKKKTYRYSNYNRDKDEDKESVRENYVHCQICFASDGFEDNSYSIHSSNKMKMIENAHIIGEADKGPAIQGNLLSLCTFHHREYGDRITSPIILDALEEQGLIWEKGIIHTIKLLEKEEIKIFFLPEHKQRIIDFLKKQENENIVSLSSHKLA